MTDTLSIKKTSENPQEGAEGSILDQEGLTAGQAQEKIDVPFEVAWLFHSKLFLRDVLCVTIRQALAHSLLYHIQGLIKPMLRCITTLNHGRMLKRMP